MNTRNEGVKGSNAKRGHGYCYAGEYVAALYLPWISV